MFSWKLVDDAERRELLKILGRFLGRDNVRAGLKDKYEVGEDGREGCVERATHNLTVDVSIW